MSPPTCSPRGGPGRDFDPDQERFLMLLLTTRKRVKGHHVVGIGLLDQVLVHARFQRTETFQLPSPAAGGNPPLDAGCFTH